MSHQIAREIILSAWSAVWTADALAVDLPVEIQNLPFKRPTTGPWGRLTLIGAQTEPASLGATHTRTPFVLTLQVFIPENTGTLVAYAAAVVMSGLDGTVARSNDGKVVVNFRTAGIAPGVPESGIEAFVVTIPGSHDIYG